MPRLESVFDIGFNDQILHQNRSLKVLINYIRDNPRRLIVRKLNPTFFQRVNSLKIGEGVYSAYGNLQLLDNPFKEQVVVHRADSEETRRLNRERWLYTAANGGVLVSPFISPAEKAIRAEAETFDSKIILITDEKMHDRFKPASADFELCLKGRMLIISVPNVEGVTLRQHFLRMNSMAKQIC